MKAAPFFLPKFKQSTQPVKHSKICDFSSRNIWRVGKLVYLCSVIKNEIVITNTELKNVRK